MTTNVESVKITKGIPVEISFNDLEEGSLVQFISWNRILPYIEEAITIRQNESITGLRIDSLGISICMKTNN